MGNYKSLPTAAALEEALIREALALADTKREAAEMIGMSRRTFFRRLKEYGIKGGNAVAMTTLLRRPSWPKPKPIRRQVAEDVEAE